MAKKIIPSLSNDELRQMILQYFYDRNANATSRKGKKGSAIKMQDIKSQLKAKHNLIDKQIISNLTYLISQGWVSEDVEAKSFTNDKGMTFPQKTTFYSITAKGIDKIEGPSQFTPKRFEGINIQATGSVVTIGDGNQINVKFKEAAQALAELRNGITHSEDVSDEIKLDIVTDIDSIQDQLAKPNPNKSVIKTLWTGIEKTVTIGSLVDLISKASPLISGLIGQ
jgi:hypothetical protein